MKTFEEILATLPEGYGFCIRDDEEYGYMANVTSPTFVNDPDIAITNVNCFPVYDRNLNRALEKSIELAKKARIN